MAYFTGKGYGVSDITDLSGRPLLTYQGPNDKTPILLSDRVAVLKDPTIRQTWTKAELYNPRMPKLTSTALKSLVGGTSVQELDHKIPLELGGSNSITNLRLENFVPGTINTPTDPLENELAMSVMSGRISLELAWRAMASEKGYLLGEVSPTGVQITFTNLFPIIQSVLSSHQSGFSSKVAKADQDALIAQVAQNAQIVKENPYDLNARQAFFDSQIAATQAKTGMTTDEAVANVITTIRAYASSQGQNPANVSVNLGTVQGQLNHAMAAVQFEQSPLMAGMMMTAVSLIGAAPIIVGAVIVTIIIVAAFAGPEVLAGLSAVPFLSSLVSALGISTGAGILSGIALYIEFIVLWGSMMAMIVKQYGDTQVISATMVQTAAKAAGIKLTSVAGAALPVQQYSNDAQAQAAASGGTIPEQPLPTSSYTNIPGLEGGGALVAGNVPTYTPTVPASQTPSVASASVSGTSVHVSVVSGGVLGSPATFTPATSDIFENMTELQSAAEENIASYLGAIAGQLAYEFRLVGKITLADGTVRIGTTQSIIKGYTKGSAKRPSHPEYKKVTNKFLVADIKYKTLAGAWKKLDEIVVGAVDETGFQPSAQDLAGLGDAISSYLVANHLGGVTQINLPSPAIGQPTQTAPAQMTAPTETPSAAAASLTAAFQPTTPTETAAIANAVAQIPTTVAPVTAQPPAQKTYSIGSGTGNTMVYNVPYTTDGTSVQYYSGPDGGGPNITQRQNGISLLNKQVATPQQAATQAEIITPAVTPATKPNYCLVGNLYDYWNAKGLPHPGVAANGLKYQALGLGSASVFVGSVGQNTALLQALQKADGC